MKRKFLLIMIVGLGFMTSCAQPALPDNVKTPIETPLSKPVENAREMLSVKLGLPLESIEVIGIESVTWPDACLGIYYPDQLCATVVTPGFKITLQAQGESFIYHSDEPGNNVILFDDKDQPREVEPVFSPPAIQAAKEFLASHLNIKPVTITIISFEERQWPDGCLGIANKDEMCIQVITPGYEVNLEAEGQIYILRTNQTGSLIRLAPGPSDPNVYDR